MVARAQRILEAMGCTPVLGSHVLSCHGFCAGTDEQRCQDLHAFFKDESIKAVFVLTGGYGALRLLAHLDFDLLASNPKLLVGGDDATCLLNALNTASGLVCLHGPNLDQINTQETFDRLYKAVTSTKALPPLTPQGAANLPQIASDFVTCVEGIVEGPLVGGNLTSFASLSGTRFEPDMKGKIIFLEDINEQNGILDRWFTTLYLAGHLQYAEGVVCGSFENCSPKDSTNMLSVMEMFSDRLKYLGKISCFGMPFGQQSRTTPLPIGINARLNATQGLLEFLEPAFVSG